MFDMGTIFKRLTGRIVGREKELAIILSAIHAKMPVLLVGLPGVSKTTILNAISEEIYGSQRVIQVTGDEQLSAYSLVGSFDPALVIKDGYKSEYFTAGPLTKAMIQGGILYVEEFNRAPSGALNALMTALSDGYIEIPRYGQVRAASGFTLIGSSNPADDVGTERLSRGLADRFVMVELAYQSEEEELEIVRRKHKLWSDDWIRFAVYIARATRVHPDLRSGASIRGSIAFLNLLSGWNEPSEDIMYSSGIAAFLGKVKVKSSSGRTGKEIILEIMRKKFTPENKTNLLEHWKKSAEAEKDSSGGALVETNGSDIADSRKGGAIREQSGPSPPMKKTAREGTGEGGIRGESYRKPDGLPFMDLQVRVTHQANPLTKHREKPWLSFEDTKLWAEVSARTFRAGDVARRSRSGARLSTRPWNTSFYGDIDVDRTLSKFSETSGYFSPGNIQVRYRVPLKRDFVIFIDHSGSMVGEKLAFSAGLAGALARLGSTELSRYGVYAFDQEISEIKSLVQSRDTSSVIQDIFHLPEGRSTDLSGALQFALQLLDDEDSDAADVILVSDCMPTRGEKNFRNLNKIVQKIPNLYICYMNSKIGNDFPVETDSGICQLDLYGWWGYKWVGSDHFFSVDSFEDVPDVLNMLIGHRNESIV
ncbi:VWA domain-containing protein [Sporolactobacillus shoreae]|uniref:VWA domain-containing protein n=1 Tax=Sporolactobacillus shoreae TaxID=1465501 RepID=A0A4Z0GTL8_9BACL|nr:AAA family ATPase [Sporolactobacillus shoreae]TGA99893.1 VWA domain-containing protein [Sporolactobacillus shoreae]